jgi:hypothetical protein
MKRLIALVTVLTGLALAQVPAYPENTVGIGFGIGRGLVLEGSTPLPFSPLGIDTGLDAEVIVPTAFNGAEVWALFKADLLPALTLGDLPFSVGVGLDASFNTLSGIFGSHLGPLATVEIPGGAISGYLGIGYEGGFNLAYGLGGRLYLDPVALEVSVSDRYPLKLAVLYLW